MPRLVIISNQLPVQIEKQDNGSYSVEPTISAVSSGLENFFKESNSIWIGRPGFDKNDFAATEREEITKKLRELNCYPVYLNSSQREAYLEGFSNNTLWPLFHYFTEYAAYKNQEWISYCKVNDEFARVVNDILDEEDQVWIHDYHLMLLPRLIRKRAPENAIGFFMHIPFPSYEIFRILPWRTELLEGLLGADLIGFHTYDYVRHFMSCIRRLLGHESFFNQIQIEDRTVNIDFFPMGVNFARVQQIDRNENAREDIHREVFRDPYIHGEDKKLILSIDRLDYTKGIPLRLAGFELFLQNHPEYLEKVSLLLYVTPSREKVTRYKEIKAELDEIVGRINSRYGTLNWMPIWYFFRQLEFEELMALYRQCNIAMVTPIRDGMNMMAKEYVAAQTDTGGILILSEMAGAAKEMSESIMVNPNNRSDIAFSILVALEMDQEEINARNRIMQERLKRYDVEKWANEFVSSLKKIHDQRKSNMTRKISVKLRKEIVSQYHNAENRILFLDYDGTLAFFKKDPQAAGPDDELIDTLKKLAGDKKNKVIIISGRDKETLGKWFPPDWNIFFIAEHGVWMRDPGEDWRMFEQINKDWMDRIRYVLQFYVDRTPRSFIEQKNYSLAWHYRDADPDLGVQRAWELKDELKDMVANLNLEIMDGDKVIEIKNSGINKGRAALHAMGPDNYDFMFAIGDDWTDEYTFESIPDKAITIKVGAKRTRADYFIDGVSDVRSLLKSFTETQS